MTGCSTTSKSTSETQATHPRMEIRQSEKKTTTTGQSADSSKEQYYAKGLVLTLGEISISKKEDKKILLIRVQAKNESNEEKGFGSNDFRLKIGKEELLPYADGINFGEAIAKGETYEGTMSFEVPSEANEAKLIYQPYDPSEAEWIVNF